VKILLHLGAHRTGTTALQRHLAGNGATLGAAGLAYWGPRRLRGGLFRGLYAPPEQRAAGRAARRASGRIAMRLCAEAEAGTGAVIVSEENMLGTLRDCLAQGVLYPGAGARVARFAAPFRGREVRLVLTVRDPAAWWASALAFQLSRGGPLPTPALCARLAAGARGWRDVVSDIADAVPWARLTVLRYDGTTSPATWSAAVWTQLTGVAPMLAGTPGRHNAAAGPACLRALAAEAGADPAVIRVAAGRFRPFDPDQRRRLAARYAADLSWLQAGADGLVCYIDAQGATDAPATGRKRGRTHEGLEPDDGHRRVARAG
jgi:hypothetical protein